MSLGEWAALADGAQSAFTEAVIQVAGNRVNRTADGAQYAFSLISVHVLFVDAEFVQNNCIRENRKA